MVRECKDPGIDLPERAPPDMRGFRLNRQLQAMNKRSHKSRVTKEGIGKVVGVKLDVDELAALDVWASGDGGISRAALVRLIVVSAIACRERGRQPIAILQAASQEAGG